MRQCSCVMNLHSTAIFQKHGRNLPEILHMRTEKHRFSKCRRFKRIMPAKGYQAAADKGCIAEHIKLLQYSYNFV